MTDTLSDVFRALRLSGAIFFSVDASDPWVARTPDGAALAPHLVPDAEHVIGYHVITSGTCWAGLVGEPRVRLEAGDGRGFPTGDSHILSSTPNMDADSDISRYRGLRELPLPIALSIQGGGNEQAKFICGFLGCDARPFNPLLSSMPRIIHWKGAGDTGLKSIVELALAESNAPKAGSNTVLSRLAEVLFVEIVRRYLTTLSPEAAGWFAGLRDESVGRALQKIHERPAHDWSLEELAREAGLSRSMLAARFLHFVGTPPIQYLGQWRIQLAASLLRTSQSSLAEIAEQVGYGSEAALSRAFKRSVGVPPAHYRRG